MKHLPDVGEYFEARKRWFGEEAFLSATTTRGCPLLRDEALALGRPPGLMLVLMNNTSAGREEHIPRR